jgi:hypothetical protein
MGYGTRPHDWKTDELESMKPSLCLTVCVGIPLFYVTQPRIRTNYQYCKQNDKIQIKL